MDVWVEVGVTSASNLCYWFIFGSWLKCEFVLGYGDFVVEFVFNFYGYEFGFWVWNAYITLHATRI